MDVIRPISKTTTSNNNRTNGGAIATLGTQPLTVGIITSLGEEGIADLDPTERGGAGGLAALDAVLDLGVRHGLVLAPAPAGSVGGGLGDTPGRLGGSGRSAAHQYEYDWCGSGVASELFNDPGGSALLRNLFAGEVGCADGGESAKGSSGRGILVWRGSLACNERLWCGAVVAVVRGGIQNRKR